MNKIIKKDILAILSDTIEILKVKEEKGIAEMKELSNHVIHNASIFQDEDSISIAILIYSLSKIIERKDKELNYSNILNQLKASYTFLEKSNTDNYRKTIKRLFKFISTVDTKLKLYIEEVINQAQIKKGSKIYEHGISLARASEILGISQWELMFYIGKTKIPDVYEVELISLKKRLNYTKSLFK